MTPSQIMARVKDYAYNKGATIKCVGDYAYKSPHYNQKNNKGRFIKYIGIKGDFVYVYDNKKGRIFI